VSDLHRTILVYCALWLVLRAQGHAGPFYADALLSVKRSWRPRELQRLADLAGLPGVTVSVLSGARVLVAASKEQLSDSGTVRIKRRVSTDKPNS
jgi:hypothetical protein